MNVGIVGCGVISREYARNAQHFDAYDVTVCADALPGAADKLAAEHGLRATTIDELLADPSVDVVLNLTPPDVHGAVIRAALAAGKHVYTEKPIDVTVAESAELVADADRRGLRIGVAPDVFLAGPYQAARRLIDGGVIGEPLAVSAAMLAGGQSSWHPNPDIFYRDGAGPLLDMGPYYVTAIVALLGPIRRVAGFASTRAIDRVIEIGPRAGTPFTPETPTHTAATLELDGGVTANLTATFEAGAQYIADFTVYGTEGRLILPDPNSYGGPLQLRRGREEAWQDVPLPPPSPRDGRGLGLADLVTSIGTGAAPRASGELGRHVVEVARGILAAAEAGASVAIESAPARPAPLA